MTFTEWRGNMDWPLDPDWECEVCGNDGLWAFLDKEKIQVGTGLEWSLIPGLCRCTKCHAEYNMRDRDSQRVTKPISRLKPEYKAAARLGWEPLGLPLDEWTDHMWTVALEWAQEGKADEWPPDFDDQLGRQQMAGLEPPREFEQDPTNPCGALDPRF